MARDVVMVNGLPGSGKSTLGPRLAAALGAAYLSKDRVKEALADAVVTELPALGAVAMDTVWALAAATGGMAVVDSWWFKPRDLGFAQDGLARSGASASVEVWCRVPAATARSRFVARRRRSVYEDDARLAGQWSDWAARAEPLGLGPVIQVDTTGPVDLVRLCSDVRAALWTKEPPADR